MITDPRPADSPTTINEGIMTVKHLKLRECSNASTSDVRSTEAEEEEAMPMLRAIAVSAFMENVKYGGYGWKEQGIPALYVGGKRDLAITISMQEDHVERLKKPGCKVEMVWLDGDHLPFLRPAAEELADMIPRGL